MSGGKISFMIKDILEEYDDTPINSGGIRDSSSVLIEDRRYYRRRVSDTLGGARSVVEIHHRSPVTVTPPTGHFGHSDDSSG